MTGRAEERFRLMVAEPSRDGADLQREVAQGLRSIPKRIPCRFFYDPTGSKLFEEICQLPEYYLTRAEDEILSRHAAEIVSAVPRGSLIVELGSGSARKTRRLIEAAHSRAEIVHYMPIDISRSVLEESAQALLADYPGLSIRAIAGEYEDGLRLLSAALGPPKLVLWLGSNVGNLDRVAAGRFLARLAAGVGREDRLLIGVDLRKPKNILERAYDDARGVTARFNLNLLTRINMELAADFDVSRFRHVALYDEIEGRIEMHLESLTEQEVRIGKAGMVVSLRAGERIHTEDSYKYSPSEIERLARDAGMRVEREWLDEAHRFALVLLAT